MHWQHHGAARATLNLGLRCPQQMRATLRHLPANQRSKFAATIDGNSASVASTNAVATTAGEGVLATAKTLAGSLLNAAAKTQAAAPENEVTEEEALKGELEEEIEDAEVREIAVEGEAVQVRAETAHEAPGPRVRSGKSKKNEKQAAADSLAHLDDTRLPDGAEEYVLPASTC